LSARAWRGNRKTAWPWVKDAADSAADCEARADTANDLRDSVKISFPHFEKSLENLIGYEYAYARKRGFVENAVPMRVKVCRTAPPWNDRARRAFSDQTRESVAEPLFTQKSVARWRLSARCPF
jgi:hypothetical protein